MSVQELVIATRGSDLALWQSRQVAEKLAAAGVPSRLLVVKTVGDSNKVDPLEKLGGTGLFTKEVDREVLEGRAHLAVHSLKDQETTLAPGLTLAMTLPRGPVEDVLVGEPTITLENLEEGAVVGTGSLRRRAQLLRIRPDLTVRDIRGNVDTRLRQRAEGKYEALVMARAGLERLSLHREIAQVLTVSDFLPAPSQGIVGVTCLATADPVVEILQRIDDRSGHVAGRAERAFLRRLGGGCNVPVGALATVTQETVHLQVRVISLDGKEVIEGARSAAINDVEQLGISLAEELLGQGADALIAGMRLGERP